ncbi:MAG: hypothetical protein LBC94_08065 [Desulfovibrio sp.]|jgi:tryptophan synthase beta subunit|nr:hypothetical protein [Desulfovibrio sp.]
MFPDAKGFFGVYGGQHIPEILAPAINAIADAYEKYKNNPDFRNELAYYLKGYAGRESPLFFAKNLTEKFGGAKIYFKREDLNHLGAHKVNNTIGQILLAKRMGKTKIIAEGVGPEHSLLKDEGRAEYVAVSDDEALDAFLTLSRAEGIIPALESSHAVAYAVKLAPTLEKDKILLVNLSGRGDKDVSQVIEIIKKIVI